MKERYKDIAPYDDSVFHETMSRLVKEPGFENALNYIMPGIDHKPLVDTLLGITNKEDFQKKIMIGILKLLEDKTTAGVSDSGIENLPDDHNVLFITNHRDIVLDASFLGLVMIRNGKTAQEVALGDNLLIYPWIEDLVRLNKGIIVKRNLRLKEALLAAKQLSGYIHYCINEKRQSVWIAQREGRAKDSNDLTQESVIKMLALEGKYTGVVQKLMELSITPTSISYEYDPNDYLKAREFLAKRRDPNFHKSQRDDLFSMEIGILRYKGRVHFAIGKCINDELRKISHLTDKVEIVRHVCAIIDREIHLGYKIYPINYIAYDQLNGNTKFSTEYTGKDVDDFNSYIEKQLDMVDLPDITPEERGYMRNLILTMYSNPLRNKLAAMEHETTVNH